MSDCCATLASWVKIKITVASFMARRALGGATIKKDILFSFPFDDDEDDLPVTRGEW